MQAAEQDPNFKTPYRVQIGVLAYLGRAYYETDRNAEARSTLEMALAKDKDDALAHLYLGLVLARAGDAHQRLEVPGLGDPEDPRPACGPDRPIDPVPREGAREQLRELPLELRFGDRMLPAEEVERWAGVVVDPRA